MSEKHTLDQSGEGRERALERSLERAAPPTVVPGYEPLRFLGSGAYGEVWVAVDRNTGRNVAVKFYAHRGGLDWSLLSREVEKLSFLFGNRHVVQLLDVGWEADPPYYVMEYMERGSLEDRLSAGPIPAAEAIATVREVTTGLLHAHGKGVLHCDLKPANVLIGLDGKPRLADFGQSRLSHEQTPALGTLFYMAPEQADLQATPDARWDVYALGALFYAMLTGKAPYRSDEASRYIDQGGSLAQRLERYRQWIRKSPRPKAHRAVPGVDRPLAEIIDRCLYPNPARRFANVQAVIEALDQRSVRRARRPLLVLGALGPAILLLVMALFAWAGYRAAIGQSEAVVRRRAVESNRFAAQFVAETVAREIDHRWHVLEQEAADADFRDVLARGWDKSRGSPERDALQTRIETLRAGHPEVESTSWFITSPTGRSLARSPFNESTVDGDYSYRDYFHGLGRQLPKGSKDVKPIQNVYRSNVFVSTATHNRMVAFSVPVWSGSVGDSERKVLGVLAMTVELGRFAELRAESNSAADQIATLVDSREDENARQGSILEHPELARLLNDPSTESIPGYYLDSAHVALIDKLRPLKQQIHELRGQLAELQQPTTSTDLAAPSGTPEADQRRQRAAELEGQLHRLSEEFGRLALREEYSDPVEGDYQGRWLAAMEPVLIEGRAKEVQDTGWVVLVQERHEAAMRPVRALGSQLLWQGAIALGVVVAVVTVLWGFVILILNESSRSGVLGSVRRRVGLASEGTGGTQSGNAGLGSATPGTGSAGQDRSASEPRI